MTIDIIIIHIITIIMDHHFIKINTVMTEDTEEITRILVQKVIIDIMINISIIKAITIIIIPITRNTDNHHISTIIITQNIIANNKVLAAKIIHDLIHQFMTIEENSTSMKDQEADQIHL